MPRIRLPYLSLKHLSFGIICLNLMAFALLIFCIYCNIFSLARISVKNWVSNSSHRSGFFPAYGTSSSGNQRHYQREFTKQRDQPKPTSSMSAKCSTLPGQNHGNPCRSAGERSFHEVVPQDSFITSMSTDYFKVRPEIVQHLVTGYLAVPKFDSFSSYYLVAVQASISDRRHERDTVRNTWGSAAIQQTWPNRTINAHIKVIFVVARHITADNDTDGSKNSSRELEEIKSEADLHNDILYLDMIDSYQNLTLKMLSAFKWVKNNCPCVKFVLKVDYDTFVNVPLLVDTLLYFEDRFQFSILGYVYTTHAVVRRSGKWNVPKYIYPMDKYPPYASDFSQSILKLMAIFNGKYDNSGQIKGEHEKHDRIIDTAIPVNVPALSGEPVLYFEEADEGKVYRRQLLSLYQDSSEVIYGTVYNYTDVTQCKPGDQNFDEFATLSRDRLQTDKSCTIAFELVADNAYMTTWPDCGLSSNGKHPAYVAMVNCDNMSFEPPLSAPETIDLVAYKFQNVGKRYPLIGAPDNFVNPCGKKK